MELKQFIKNALVSVVEGVSDANKEYNRFQISGGYHSGKDINGEYIEFDLSVMVDETKESGKKSGIFVALANLGVGKSFDNK